MKILHLSHNNILNDARTIKQIFEAVKNGYEVEGICLNLEKTMEYTKLIDHSTVQLITLYSRKLRYPRLLRHFFACVEMTLKFYFIGRKKVKKDDLIHCSDVVSLPASLLIKLATGAKLVYDAHELESERNGSRKLDSYFTYIFEKLSWRFIDSFITVSPSIQKWYLDHFTAKKSEVVLNTPFIKNENVSHEPSDYLARKYSTGQELIFIYVGIICQGRGIESMLDVFSKEHRKSHLVFLGYGPLENLVREKMKTRNNIHLHYGVAHEEMLKIVSSADFGLCMIEPCSLSDIYALPNKLFEYCFSGLPVVASNLPDISSIIEKYQLGITTDPKTESLENVVSRIEMQKERHSIDLELLDELSWSNQATKLLNLYSKTS